MKFILVINLMDSYVNEFIENIKNYKDLIEFNNKKHYYLGKLKSIKELTEIDEILTKNEKELIISIYEKEISFMAIKKYYK